MAKENKNQNKKPKVSPYWIYGIIIAVFLGLQIFGSSALGGENAADINPSAFFDYLKNGDVEKVVIVNERQARVYLTNERQIIDLNLVIYNYFKNK